MSAFRRSIPTALAITVAVALNLVAAKPASAEAALSNTSMQSSPVSLHNGDLVRVRSGGPLMTVIDIQGNKVNCFWTDWDGQLKSETFPVAVLQGPITTPPDDPNLDQEQKAADQQREHCPSGTLSVEGDFKCAD